MKPKTLKIKKPFKRDVMEFLRESNAIESVYSKEALEDAEAAWKYAMTQEVIGLPQILQIHKLIAKRMRPDIAGFWRNVPVRIGGNIKHFVSVQLIEEDLSVPIVMMNSKPSGNPKASEKLAQQAHVLFEGVHPFEDFNGRVGRILYNWHRIKMGLPLHIIHEGPEQMQYYRWFKGQ